MGKPKTTDVDALSLHTTPDDYAYDDLPAYSDNDAVASGSNVTVEGESERPTLVAHAHPLDEYTHIPVNETIWSRSGSKKSSISSTSIRMDTKLNDPYHMYAYIMDVVRMLPPTQMINLSGTHTEKKRDNNGKETTETVTDFDIYLPMDSMLRPALEKGWWYDYTADNTSKTYRGTFRKVTAPNVKAGTAIALPEDDEPTPDLKAWCERYCENKAMLKAFRIQRHIDGVDEGVLKQLVHTLIKSTYYQGHISITFPVSEKNVDIYSPHWINKCRTSWIRYIFYISMLWIITWPILFFMTKWYTVYHVHWIFAKCVDIHEEQRSVRKYAVMTEKSWFDYHRAYLRHLIVNHHTGVADASIETVNAFNSQGPQPEPTTGNADLDGVVSTVAGGLNLWNQIRSGRSQPSSGAWGYDRR